MEACWAHNPEVRRSKLRSAKDTFLNYFPNLHDELQDALLQYNVVFLSFLYRFPNNLALTVPLAQRIARWTSNPKVLGSIPRWDDISFLGYHTMDD